MGSCNLDRSGTENARRGIHCLDTAAMNGSRAGGGARRGTWGVASRAACASKVSRALACINGGGGQAGVVGIGAGGGASSCGNLKGAASSAMCVEGTVGISVHQRVCSDG
eukprot:1234564-Rhodomonas_salina.1